MSAKLCPMASNLAQKDVHGDEQDCLGEHCAWWHGGMCDVSRVAGAMDTIVGYSLTCGDDGDFNPVGITNVGGDA